MKIYRCFRFDEAHVSKSETDDGAKQKDIPTPMQMIGIKFRRFVIRILLVLFLVVALTIIIVLAIISSSPKMNNSIMDSYLQHNEINN